MPILFINNKLPLFEKASEGGSNRSNLFIEALSKIDEIDLISFTGEEYSNLTNCKIVFSKYIPKASSESGFAVKFPRIWKFVQLFKRNKINDYYPYSKEKAAIVQSYMNRKKYDHIACRYLEEAFECGLFNYSDRLILDVDDSPLSQLKALLSLYKEKSSFRNWAYKYVYFRLLSLEFNGYLEKPSVTFHSSPTESHAPNSIFLHNLSSISDDNPVIADSCPLRVTMVAEFFKSFSNIDGLEHFVEYIWPKVLRSVPDAKFYAIGNIREDVKQRLENYPYSKDSVVIKGFVKDLLAEYRDSRVIVVPLTIGSGTSIKTIEGIMSKRPIVSTTVGIRGFSEKLIAGTHYMLANNDEEFADAVIGLLKDLEYSRTMAESAYSVYKDNWSKEKFERIVFDAIMENRHAKGVSSKI